MNEERQTDKRIVKTRRAIRDALMSILEDKPIHDVTIKELSERAGINRKTFYAHYDSIDAVIAELEDELVAAMQIFLSEDMIAEAGMGPQYFIQFVNSIYMSNPGFFENLMTIRNYSFLAEKIKTTFKNALFAIPSLEKYDRTLLSGIVEFAAGGLTSLYVRWIRDGKTVPFSTITSLALHLTMNGLSEILPIEFSPTEEEFDF